MSAEFAARSHFRERLPTIDDFTTAIVREWGFDRNDRLTSHKDDAGNNSTWTYDALGRPTELKYPDLEKVTYVYDHASNVTKTTDAAGNVIDDVYDLNNRRTLRTVTRATGFLGTTSETFAYDGLGRMTKAEDNDYKVEFTHAVVGLSSQVYEEKQSYVGGSAYLKTVTRTYDAVGNKITELYPSSLDLDYTWNDVSRLSTVTDGTNTIASYAYIGVRREKVTFESGATASYTYTGFRGEVDRIHHETSTPATILDLQYGYDDNHDRTYERFGGSGAGADVFEYDKARRLTTAWMGSVDVTAPSTSVYTKKVVYTMDDDGNRNSIQVTPYGQSATTTSYTGNNLNQYTVVGGVNQTHDHNGNLTDDGTLDFEYDYKNQIVRVKQSSTTIAEYKYDALGRRVEKDDQTDVQRFIYSGPETVSVYDGSNTWVRDFVFGAVIDEVLMLEQADVLDYDSDSNTTEKTRSYYHRNALGSVLEITDANEAVVASYRYDPYGDVTITVGGTPQSSDPLGQPWTYTGRHSDEETGLYYYRARYYSPQTGRFLQRDPLGYAPGAGLYEYVRSAPVRLTDPLGEAPPDLQQDTDWLAGQSSADQERGSVMTFQGTLDQWLETGWMQDEAAKTWLLRLRTTATGRLVANASKALVATTVVRSGNTEKTIRQYYVRVWVYMTAYTANPNPNQSLWRQLATYGERLRGAHNASSTLVYKWEGYMYATETKFVAGPSKGRIYHSWDVRRECEWRRWRLHRRQKHTQAWWEGTPGFRPSPDPRIH